MAAHEPLRMIVVAAFEPVFLVPTLALVTALLVGAVVVALFRRWQHKAGGLSPGPSDQLAQFRSLYEQGAISEEEYRRLRTVLGGELRRSADLPVAPSPGDQPAPSDHPESPAPPHEHG